MSTESHVFEVDLIVRAHGQPDATIHREYTSADAASTDKAVSEVWAGLAAAVKARMRPVNDGA